MASTNQESQSNTEVQRAQPQRLLLLVLLALMLIRWGPRTADMLEKGWSSSHLVLQRQEEISQADRRLDALQREVAYAQTSEGKDVEAKRRFGVGPRDEIWITVDAEPAPPARPRPQSIADRLDSWLTHAGSQFVDRIRAVGAVVSYAVGLSDVDGAVAVPVVEDLEPAAKPGGEDAELVAPADNPPGDGEVAGDATQQ